MSYRHTLEAAVESLHEIEDLIRSFPTDGKIPPIDLDLSLQKIRNLYELLIMLNKPAEAEVLRMEPVRESVGVLVSEKAPVEVPPAIELSPKVEPVMEPARVAPPEGPKPNHVPQSLTPKEPAEGKILSDRFRGRTTLHESLHHTTTKDNVTLSQARPVDNLMAAIGINDRFTFIRELFGNDTVFFEQTIRILNDAASFNDAYNYMIQNHDWDMDSDPVQLLLEIIRRKFITGRHE